MATLIVGRGIFVVFFLAFIGSAFAQTHVSNVAALRTTALGGSQAISLDGYSANSDGGGGILQQIGVSSTSCYASYSVSLSNGSTTVNFNTGSTTANITAGMGINGTGIPAGDSVAAVNSSTQITLVRQPTQRTPRPTFTSAATAA